MAASITSPVPSPSGNDSSWEASLLAESGGLQDRNLFNIDFERGAGSGVSGTVWIAASDGLYRYDGYEWNHFSREHGLPSDLVRCVHVSKTGDVWVGTDRGAGVFREGRFETRGSEKGLAGQNVRRIEEESDGTLWFCSDTWPKREAPGGLTSYRGGEWKAYGKADGLPDQYVVGFYQDPTGRRWVATGNGVAEWRGDRWVTSLLRPPDSELPWGSGCFAEVPGGMLFSLGRSQFLLTEKGWRSVPVNIPHQHGLVKARDGNTYACGMLDRDRKSLIMWKGQEWVRASSDVRASDTYTEDIREAPDGAIWVVGYGTLIRWQPRPLSWTEVAGVPEPRLADAHGRLWFSSPPRETSPGSLMRWNSGTWERLEPPREDLVRDTTGGVWGWTTKDVTRWDKDSSVDFTGDSLGMDRVLRLLADGSGFLWLVGVDSQGRTALAKWDGSAWMKIAAPDIPGTFRSNTLCADRDGVWGLQDDPAKQATYARHLGGAARQEIVIPSTIMSLYRIGLFADSQGSLWLTGDAGLYRWKLGESKSWEEIHGLPGRLVRRVMESGGALWFLCDGATGGTGGVGRFRQGVWSTLPLPSVRGLQATDSGEVLALSAGKLHRLAPDGALRASQMDLPSPAVPDSVVLDSSRKYWVGVPGKVFIWGSDGIPPRSFLTAPATNVLAGRNLVVDVAAVERFQPRGARKDQQFSWRIDDGEWSPYEQITHHTIPTQSLAAGEHWIEFRARDAGLDVEDVPSRLAFFVLPVPLQSQPWFLPVLITGLAIVAALAAIALRARMQLAGYAGQLEARVEERQAQWVSELSRRQAMAEELKVSEERFAKVFNASPALIAISTYPEGIYVDVNPHYTLLLGYTRDQVLGRRAADFNIWVNPEERTSIVEAVGRGETIRGVECRLRAQDGHLLTVLASVERLDLRDQPCLLFINHDISDRKAAENELSKLHAWQKTVLDHAPYAIISVNPDGIIQTFNKAAEEILGYTADEMIGKTTPLLIHDKEEVQARARELSLEMGRVIEPGFEAFVAKARQGVTSEMEWTFIRRDNERVPVNLSVAALRSPTGELTGFIGIAQDLRHRRHLEDQLRQAQKLEAIGLLSSGIAHDFNNILGAILGNVELAAMDTEPGGQVSGCLSEIRKAGLRAKHLIQQILAFGRQQPQERQVVSLQPVLEEAVALLRATIPAGVALRVRVEKATPMVFVDTNQMHQIIVNLCTNAWQALEGKPGSIDITLEPAHLDARTASRMAGVRPGLFARLEVRDTGKGMDEATLDRIFEPFFTTKAPGKGTGLGLAVVHGIIRSHEGAMEVASKPGKGSTFTLFLPATQKASDQQDITRGKLLKGSGQRILYIDDEEPLLQLAQRSLERIGYRVTGFTMVDQALAAFRANPQEFALVITDYNIPGFSGLRVAQEILEIRPDVPVLVSSGYVTEDLKQKARKIGVRHVLHKPNTMEEFSNAVHLLITELRQP